MLDFARLKKLCLYILIGSLIASAAVAVIAVLVGELNNVTMRIFSTLLIVMFHTITCLFFIWDDSRRNTFETLPFFVNTVFVLIIASFFTSVFGLWDVVPSDLAGKLYSTYFCIGFASLHCELLSKALGKERYMDAVIFANYFLIAAVFLMTQVIVYLNNAEAVLGSFFYRLLAAGSIIDGTLSILTIVFYKLYMHKHPKENDLTKDNEKTKRKGLSFWLWILLLFLLFQFVAPVMFLMVALFSHAN